jgi:hypothetical protein
MRFLSTKTHGVLDYLVSILLIIAPWVLGFAGNNTATYVPVALGLVTVMYSLLTNYEWGAVKVISMPMHIMLDFVSGVLLAASPWLFGFSNYIFMPHLVVGILEILISLITQPLPYSHRPHSADVSLKQM